MHIYLAMLAHHVATILRIGPWVLHVFDTQWCRSSAGIASKLHDEMTDLYPDNMTVISFIMAKRIAIVMSMEVTAQAWPD
jgi:hypothetical protein